MDKLSQILQNLSFNAEVFFSGNFCTIKTLGGSDSNKGHLHLLKSGGLQLVHPDIYVIRPRLSVATVQLGFETNRLNF